MSSLKPAGAGLFAATALGSSFALAACCALPMAFAAIGLGSSWLVPLVMATEPHTILLRAAAIVSILASVILVAVDSRSCAPGDLCARRGFRLTIYGAALLSATLLAAGTFYA